MKKSLPVLVCFLLFSGCSFLDLFSVKLMHKKAERPETKIVRNLSYRQGPSADPKKHRLDLYLPEGKGWPVLIFVHGGGWNTGDKSLSLWGVEPYANIGRYFAAQGIGVAVINYRLLPKVPWPEQIQDVAGAVAWVYRHARDYGGNPNALFLFGHSAGAQLATRVTLDPEPLRAERLSNKIVSGIIAVSGAGYEITTPLSYFVKRFGRADPSLLRFVNRSAPPFLILYASAEPLSIINQSKLLAERLKTAGVPVKTVVVPHRDHVQIVMMLSREGIATKTIKKFIQEVDISSGDGYNRNQWKSPFKPQSLRNGSKNSKPPRGALFR